MEERDIMLTNALVKSALKQKTLKVELQGKIINGTLKMKIMLLNMKVISNNKNGVEIKKEVTDEGAEEEVGVIDKVIGEALNDVLNAARKDILLMPVQIQMLKGAQGVHKNALNAERKAINHSNVQRLGNSARGKEGEGEEGGEEEEEEGRGNLISQGAGIEIISQLGEEQQEEEHKKLLGGNKRIIMQQAEDGERKNNKNKNSHKKIKIQLGEEQGLRKQSRQKLRMKDGEVHLSKRIRDGDKLFQKNIQSNILKYNQI